MSSKISNENQYKLLGLYKWHRPLVPSPYSIQLSLEIGFEVSKYLFSKQSSNPLPSREGEWVLVL